MKVKPLLQSINPSTFLEDYLQACGVKDVERYLNPDDGVLDSPWDYPNMEMAVERLKKAVDKGEKIGVVIDSDTDGQLSSAIIVVLLKHLSIEPITFFHIGKQHGLRKSVDECPVEIILENKIQLLIIPDASSSDYNEHRLLKQNGCDCIVLDHHETPKESQDAIVVNHHLGNGLNTALSGTGVAEKFCKAYAERYNVDLPDFTDMVAVSLISDVCDLTSLENRAYIEHGLSQINNPMLELMANKLNRKGINPEGFSWGTIPPINALCRSNMQDEKIQFFEALAGYGDIEEGLKVTRKAHREQTATVKAMVEEIEPNLDMEHKFIIGFTDASNKEYIGLVANKFCGKYNKPTILLREVDPTTWSGSLRSPFPLADEINSSGLAKCQGHSMACGILIKKSNLNRFIKWIDNLSIDTHPATPVTAFISPKQINLQLCKAVVQNKILWGKGLDIPTFHIKAKANQSNIQIFEKKTTTIKITIDDVTFIKFQATEDEVKQLAQWDEFEIEAIVKLDVNVWNDVESAQAMIEEWDIMGIKQDLFDFDSLF